MSLKKFIESIDAGKSVRQAIVEISYEPDVTDDPRYLAHISPDPNESEIDALVDKIHAYGKQVAKLKKAADSLDSLKAYPGDLEVAENDIKKGLLDKDLDFYYFTLQDEDLLYLYEEIMEEASDLGYDDTPSFYIITCDVGLPKGSSTDQLKELVNDFYISGKSPVALIEKLQQLYPECNLDWDSV